MKRSAEEQQQVTPGALDEQSTGDTTPAYGRRRPWRGSAHEYDFGPQDSTAVGEEQPKRRWRESAHEYDFGGHWD